LSVEKDIEMLSKAIRTYKKDGLAGLIKGAYRQLCPRRINGFGGIRSQVKSRNGLEIAGPSDVFGKGGIAPVYSIAGRIDNCHFSEDDYYRGINIAGPFVFDSKRQPGRQYILEASDLKGIEDSSYDFVMSSHVIEHLANPIKALKEWNRVIKPGGLIILIAPHKDGTFDHRRPVTTIEHLVQDYEQDIDESDKTHFQEVLDLHDLERDGYLSSHSALQEVVNSNHRNRGVHHHVFDTQLAVDMVVRAGFQIRSAEAIAPCHIAIVATK
jgi:SAM-dependent methyltransferase